MGTIWVELGLDITNVNKLDRTSPPSLVLAQAGHTVNAIQKEGKYAISFPSPGNCVDTFAWPWTNVLSAPSQIWFLCLPVGMRGNDCFAECIGTVVEPCHSRLTYNQHFKLNDSGIFSWSSEETQTHVPSSSRTSTLL